jgi:mannose-1-phosphate guanylyltransferase
LLSRDERGNAIQGDVIAQETTDSIIISDDGGLIATLGLDDVVIVQSGKATLVARRSHLDKLKGLVEGLGEKGYGAYL